MSTKDSPDLATDRPPLALIAGPTASGKSDLAIRLAKALQDRLGPAVIINADSAQAYGDLGLLSARPTAQEMRGIEHRLFGTWDGATACSAAAWAAAASEAIADVHAASGVPILVGGTGLYIRTLLEGIAPVPEINPYVRRDVRAMPVRDAYAALSREDPERAAAVAPADATRIARSLEVVRSTGQTLAQWQASKVGGIGRAVTLHPAILLPDRAALYARCDLRFARMLEQGAIAEVEALLARNLDPDLPVMRAIGVAEIAGFLRGEYGLGEVQARGAQATRNYAKRQYTWFRRQPPPDWPRIESFGETFEIDFMPIFERLLHN